MSDTTRKTLAELLNAIASEEKENSLNALNNMNELNKSSIEMLAPLKTALEGLRLETESFRGLSITTEPSILIKLETASSGTRFEVSTSRYNTCFTVNYWHSFEDESEQEYNSYQTADEVLEILIESIGKHIGQQQAGEQWRKERFG
mgnify:CR=1 FL=1|jgi:hypothetical protein